MENIFARLMMDLAGIHGAIIARLKPALAIVLTATVAAMLAAIGLMPARALAQTASGADDPASGVTVTTERAVSTVTPVRAGLVPGAVNWFVLEQTLQDGWHVYWRNPGDSGLPLETAWQGPDGFEGGAPVYPTPERIPVGPFVNYGHHGAPVFLLPLRVPDTLSEGALVDLTLNATWLICEEICVPESGSFALSLGVDPDAPETSAALIAETARAMTPADYRAGEATFRTGADRIELTLTGWDQGAQSSDDIYFFADGEGLVEPAGTQTVSIESNILTIGLPTGFSYNADNLATLTGVVRAHGAGDEARAYEVVATRNGALAGQRGSGAPLAQSDGARSEPVNLPLLLVLGFFGGALLNIMPCVFPILFVKAASFVHAAQDERGVIRRHGILYGAGVLATFLALGGLLLVLRAGGAELGWGFHLQSPPVVAFSAYVLFLVGLNLAGVFEIGGGLQNIGSGLAARGGDIGAFFTGALAVFVAAPCIGPLLSAPVGAAVLLPPLAGLSIFAVMAAGLAAPYVALSFSPGLAARLPRPGAWMGVFKQALAFPVFAAAAFFIWVLAQQVAPDALAFAMAGLIFLAFAAWAFQQGHSGGKLAPLARGLAAVAFLAAVIPAVRLAPAPAAAIGTGEKLAYDPADITARNAAGEGVFVDFTAAWCVTCQFNKATIFSRDSFGDLLTRNNVTLMTADWTRRDPEITAALEQFGASGVPLYVYYPPDGGAPKVLSLPISEASVRRAIEAS